MTYHQQLMRVDGYCRKVYKEHEVLAYSMGFKTDAERVKFLAPVVYRLRHWAENQMANFIHLKELEN